MQPEVLLVLWPVLRRGHIVIVVSYFTDEKYKKYADGLHASLVRLGIKSDIERAPDLGSWRKNTHHKAAFLRAKLDQHRDEGAVVWIDADAVVAEDLTLFQDAPFDVAAYRWRDSQLYTGAGWHNYGRLMSGTAYFKNTDFSRMVLDAWILENEKQPDRMDQKNLATVLSKVDSSRLACLPPEYCWIERYMRKLEPMAWPVVIHAASFLKGAPEKLELDQLPAILLDSYHGLGDAFYMRPAVRKTSERRKDVHLMNPWPQLFRDLPVKLVKPQQVSLRVQRKNCDRPFEWTPKPERYVERFLSYDKRDFDVLRTPPRAFMSRAGINSEISYEDFRFPVPREWTDKWADRIPRPFGVVHLPTLRREWKNPSRSPEKGYVSHLANLSGSIRWISLEPAPSKEEWVTDPPIENLAGTFTDDQLSIEDLVAIVSLADVVLTNVCFLVPMAPAVGTPIFTVFGGSVGPELLFDPCMGDKVGWVAPEPFCNCIEMTHDCNKTIPKDRLEGAWRAFLRRL